MAATVRSVATAAENDGTIAVTKPTGTADGDVLVAFMIGYGHGTSGLTAPAGFTERDSETDGTSRYGKVFTKVAASEGASYTFNVASGDDYLGVILVAVQGAATSPDDGVDGTAASAFSSSNDTTADAPSIAVNAADSLLLCAAMFNSINANAAYAVTPPSGMTEIADFRRADNFDVYSAASLALSASGATGTKTFTGTGTNVGNAGWMALSIAIYTAGSAPVYPVIATTGGEIGTSLGAANAQTLPTGSTTGDLVVVWVTSDNPSTTNISASTGWAQLFHHVHGSNVIKHAAFARVLTGGANDTLTITGAAQDYCVSSARITSHGVTAGSEATDIKIGTPADSSSGNANPPSLNAGSSQNWLWLASAGVDFTTGNTITADPTNYTNVDNRTSASSTSSCGQRVSKRSLNATTEDPGTFTNTTQEWIANTLAIPPGTTTKQGAATGTIAWAGAVTGVRSPQGAATGSIAWVGSATGRRTSSGAATGAVNWVGSSTGVRVPKGAATGSIAWVGSATGTRTSRGAASGSINWVGSATGTRASSGAATGAISWAGSVTGEAPVVSGQEGTADGSIAWSGSVTGTRPSSGAATGSIAWSGAATGTRPSSGTATGAVNWVGSATGVRAPKGAATGSIAWVGSVVGEAPAVGVNDGSATGSISWSGSATGTRPSSGSTSGTITWVGSATGTRTSSGAATGSIAWVGSATGAAPSLAAREGSTAGTITWVGSATGVRITKGAATGSITWAGVAAGWVTVFATFTGPLTTRRLDGELTTRRLDGELTTRRLDGDLTTTLIT